MKKSLKRISIIVTVIFSIFTVSGIWLHHKYDLRYVFTKITHLALKGHSPNPKYDTVYGYGIDLSHHNPEPEWDKLEVDFVILKATEGISYKDPKFRIRLNECKKRKIPVGAYHFFVGSGSSENEFNNFRNAIRSDIDIIPVLDIERKPKNISTKQFQENFYKFCKRCLDEYGQLPIIYTSEGFYITYLKKALKGKFGLRKPLLWFGDIGLKYERYVHTPEIHQAKIAKVKGSKVRLDVNELHAPLKTFF